MKRSWILVLMLSILALAACSGAQEASTNPPEEKKTPVQVTEIKKGNLQAETEMIAKMTAEANVTVLPKISGELISIKVKKGDQVKKGQVLALTDDRDLEHAYNLESANVENAKVQLETAKINLQKAEKNLETAKAIVKQEGEGPEGETANPDSISYLQWQSAKRNYERMTDLYENGAISLQQLEEAKLAEQQARISYEQSNINIDVANENVEQSKLAVKQAEVGLKQAKVRLQQASENLADTSIKSTINGEVVNIASEVGDMVSPQTQLFRIVSINPILVESQISADQLSLFNEGEDVSINVSALHQNVKGKITYISPVANESGLYTLEAEVENNDSVIKPGMVAKLLKSNILVGDAFLVPTEAVLAKSGTNVIYIVKDGKAAEVEVQVTNSQTDMTAIQGDIKEGDQVIIKGQNTLGDGMAVTVVEEGR